LRSCKRVVDNRIYIMLCRSVLYPARINGKVSEQVHFSFYLYVFHTSCNSFRSWEIWKILHGGSTGNIAYLKTIWDHLLNPASAERSSISRDREKRCWSGTSDLGFWTWWYCLYPCNSFRSWEIWKILHGGSTGNTAYPWSPYHPSLDPPPISKNFIK